MTTASAASPVAPARPARIEARGWGLRHPGRRDWALRGVDLVIEPGERVLVLGPSGAGKSTLLLAIAGLLDPGGGGATEGTLLVDGLDPRDARDRTGMLFQDPESQLVMARAGDDVAFGLENRCVPTDAIWPRVDAALSAAGFPYPVTRPTHALSGGEQQRLALARALAKDPQVLFLDEPTASLDPASTKSVEDLIRDVAARGIKVVMSTHDLGEARRLAGDIVLMHRGRILEASESTAFFSNPRTAEAARFVAGELLV
jgi:energy-coupling factor transporter ATP-binding protein EcfA2